MRALSIRTVCCAALMIVALAGCKSSNVSSTSASTALMSNKSTRLSISGAPQLAVSSGQSYTFTPTVTGAVGALTFRIANAPRWASFNSGTGRLTGTPQSGDAGTYSSIMITVSNGLSTASLPAFSITVAEAGSGSGSADLTWTPPTTNTNGSTLTDLAGYTIYYGTSPSSLTQQVKVTNVGLTNYVVTGLTSGTWYFAVAAYTSAGQQSSLSSVVSTTIT